MKTKIRTMYYNNGTLVEQRDDTCETHKCKDYKYIRKIDQVTKKPLKQRVVLINWDTTTQPHIKEYHIELTEGMALNVT